VPSGIVGSKLLPSTQVLRMMKFLLTAADASICGKPVEIYSPVLAFAASISRLAIMIFSLCSNAYVRHSFNEK
jgi:hypothetical protein